MADLTQDELLALARISRLNIPEEDVEHLTMRFNALLEALEALDHHNLDGILALPALPHPFELPTHSWDSIPAPDLTREHKKCM